MNPVFMLEEIDKISAGFQGARGGASRLRPEKNIVPR